MEQRIVRPNRIPTGRILYNAALLGITLPFDFDPSVAISNATCVFPVGQASPVFLVGKGQTPSANIPGIAVFIDWEILGVPIAGQTAQVDLLLWDLWFPGFTGDLAAVPAFTSNDRCRIVIPAGATSYQLVPTRYETQTGYAGAIAGTRVRSVCNKMTDDVYTGPKIIGFRNTAAYVAAPGAVTVRVHEFQIWAIE